MVLIEREIKMITMKLDKEQSNRIGNIGIYVGSVVDKTKKICVAIDLTDGRIVLDDKSPNGEQYKKIGEVQIESDKKTKKNIAHIATEVNKIIRDYDGYITLGRAKKEYGKDMDIEVGFIKEVDNPHYKCAAPMRLYDKNVLEYYKSKVE